MKTPFPASDDARLVSSRRSLLRGLAIAPVAATAGASTGLAIVGLPPAAAAPASSNLDRLLDMERRLREAEDALPAAHDEHARAMRAYARLCPAEPPPIYTWTTPTARQVYYYTRSMDRWRAHKARLEEETGFRAARERLEKLRDIRDGITMGEVWDIQATDLPSLKCKARMARSGMSASLTRDVLAMEG